MDIIEELILARKGKKLSQKALAKKLGIGQTTLSAYENGYNDIPFRIVLQYAREVRCKIVLFDQKMLDHLIG